MPDFELWGAEQRKEVNSNYYKVPAKVPVMEWLPAKINE